MKRSSKLSVDELNKRCREIFEDEDFGEGVESLDIFDDGIIEVEYTYLTDKPQFATRYSTKMLDRRDYNLTENEIDYLLGETDTLDNEPEVYLESYDNVFSLADLRKRLGRKETEEEYKEFMYNIISKEYDEYKAENYSEKQIWSELMDAHGLPDVTKKVFDNKHLEQEPEEYLESLTPWRIYEAADQDSVTLREFTDPYELYIFVKGNKDVAYVYLKQLSDIPGYEDRYEYSTLWFREDDTMDDLEKILKLDPDRLAKMDKTVYLEDLHPEIDLGWTRKGKRHPVDADTFTVKQKGDIISIHIEDDLPDLEYQIFDGSYLDDEAAEDESFYRDTAIEFRDNNLSAHQFETALTKKIANIVREEIMNLLKKKYKNDFHLYSGESTMGGIPIGGYLQTNSNRRIPQLLELEQIIESAGSKDSNTLNEPILLDAYVVISPTNNVIEGTSSWIPLDKLDKRSPIKLYSSQKRAQNTVDSYNRILNDYMVHKVTIKIDLSDKLLESIYEKSKLSDLTKTEQEELASLLNCKVDHIADDLSNIMIANEDTYEEASKNSDTSVEQLREIDYPLGWIDKKIWDNFSKKHFEWFDWFEVVEQAIRLSVPMKLKDTDTYLESNLNEEKSDDIYDFIEDLYNLRKNSIATEGEYGLGNLVFKEFRNLGYLDNLKELRKKEKSKELSLEQLEEGFKIKLPDGTYFKSEILPDEDLVFSSEDEANDFINKNYNRIEFANGYEIIKERK